SLHIGTGQIVVADVVDGQFNGLHGQVYTGKGEQVAHTALGGLTVVGGKLLGSKLHASIVFISPEQVGERGDHALYQCRVADKGVDGDIHRPVVCAKEELVAQTQSAHAVQDGGRAKSEGVGVDDVGTSGL